MGGAVQPSVYIRLDRGLWDGAYSVDNANLVLTIVAVQQSHPLRAYLDSQQALCPIKQSRSGPTCDCMLENFPVRHPPVPHPLPHLSHVREWLGLSLVGAARADERGGKMCGTRRRRTVATW